MLITYSRNCNLFLQTICVSLQETTRDEALAAVTVGALTVLSEHSPQQDPNSIQLQPISTAIVLEGSIVMDNIKDLYQAVCLLFGLNTLYIWTAQNAWKNTQVHSVSFFCFVFFKLEILFTMWTGTSIHINLWWKALTVIVPQLSCIKCWVTDVFALRKINV